ncbi:MAG TPA: glycoside hydrolase family 28 protein [Balneolales bacterium]|nr:glycoside hydrolase family 28 protein [Balneolales bacterium]
MNTNRMLHALFIDRSLYRSHLLKNKTGHFLQILLMMSLFILSPTAITLAKSHGKKSISRTAENSPLSGTVYNVKNYGATGNGTTLDSPAINKAIDAAAKHGGGTVLFPSGTYLSGSIRLKSNITLYLSHGAEILATSNPSAYDKAQPNKWSQYQDYGHSHWRNSLIWGINLKNISILGPGLIYGKGLTRIHNKKGIGDKTIALKTCHNVILRDFKILYGGHFGILLNGDNNVTIDNLLIDTNRDGMDIGCTQNVHISNCTVNSPYDDAIVLKSSYTLGYDKPTKDVTISDCIVSGGYKIGSVLDGTYKLRNQNDHYGYGTGRIKLGTESNGGFKNISITNCVFDRSMGLAIEEVDGGSLQDLTVSNITMRHVLSTPIFIRLGRRQRAPKGTPIGNVKRVNISNINVYDADPKNASIISGIPGHDIQNVRISNVSIVYKGGGTKKEAKIVPPEKAAGYPEPTRFGAIPSYGFYIRHVKGIEFNNINLSYEKRDERPAFILNDVQNAHFYNIHAEVAPGVDHFILKNVRNFSVDQSRPIENTRVVSTSHKVVK